MLPGRPEGRCRSQRPLTKTLTATAGGTALFAGVLFAEVLLATRGTYLEPPATGIAATVTPPAGNGPLMRIAILGDSTVAGTGAPDEQSTLPVLLARRVADHLQRPVAIRGFGVAGARTADLVIGQVGRIEVADVIVVVIGSNDATHVTAPWALQRQTSELLAALDGRPTVLGGIPRFQSATALAQPLRAVVDRYGQLLKRSQAAAAAAHDDVVFVDIATAASPRFRGVPEAMSQDGFHPAPVGYGYWADALAAGVVRAAPA